jgi:hypothetical protein
MNIESFRDLASKYRSERPGLFALASPDRPASLEQIEQVEQLLGLSLPNSYRAFLQEYGGGEFGYLTLFSADPDSEWYLPKKTNEAKTYLPESLLPIADDFAGGFYAFVRRGAAVDEHVYYWNPDGGETPTEFRSVLDFIGRYAFEPA